MRIAFTEADPKERRFCSVVCVLQLNNAQPVMRPSSRRASAICCVYPRFALGRLCCVLSLCVSTGSSRASREGTMPHFDLAVNQDLKSRVTYLVITKRPHPDNMRDVSAASAAY